MSRLETLFKNKSLRVLNVYCTAGYPFPESTLEVMSALQDNKVDIIELGMPYSDPLADGEVIQASGSRSLENGMTITRLFDQLAEMRKVITIPVVLMGYMNPVLQFGFEAFCSKAAAAGIDGLILPDLPIHEFESEFGPVLQQFRLDFIFLVTPETSAERIRKIDELSGGFIYAVSSSSTTGKNKPIEEQQAYFERLKKMNLKNPILVGFGIKDKASFEAATLHTNGAIIGSAYIKALDEKGDISSNTKNFLKGIIG